MHTDDIIIYVLFITGIMYDIKDLFIENVSIRITGIYGPIVSTEFYSNITLKKVIATV